MKHVVEGFQGFNVQGCNIKAKVWFDCCDSVRWPGQTVALRNLNTATAKPCSPLLLVQEDAAHAGGDPSHHADVAAQTGVLVAVLDHHLQ